jgi:hypothetical protein
MKSNFLSLFWLLLVSPGYTAAAAEPATDESKLQSLMEASLSWYGVLPNSDAGEHLMPQVVECLARPPRRVEIVAIELRLFAHGLPPWLLCISTY